MVKYKDVKLKVFSNVVSHSDDRKIELVQIDT